MFHCFFMCVKPYLVLQKLTSEGKKGDYVYKTTELLHGIKQSVSIPTLVEEFIEHCYGSLEHSATTMKTRATHLRQFARYCSGMDASIETISNTFINEYFVHYRKTHKASTTNTSRKIMKVFLTWARDYKEIRIIAVPTAIRLTKEPSKLPQSLSPELVREVISKTKNRQDAMMIAFFYETGMRLSEVAKLRIENIYGDVIKVHGKGSYERVVYITDTLSTMLWDHITEKKLYKHDYLFQHTHGTWSGGMASGTIRKRIQAAFMDHAAMHVVPKQLRDTYAVNLLKNGCDIVTIKTLLGHKDIQTTMTYLRLENSYTRDEYKKYVGKSLI